jgi:hypothetical protein
VATKGDRARLEPVARQLYVDQRKSLTEIEETLGVSRQTLCAWKAETKRPSEDLDEWDRARAQKRATIQRLADLYERELLAAEETAAGTVTAATWDALYKLGAMVRKWQEIERAEAVIEKGPGYDKGKVFLETLQWVAGWLRQNDPEGLKVLAADFDALTVAFKAECLA